MWPTNTDDHFDEAGRSWGKDRELVRYVGRHGIVSIAHVREAIGVGRTAAYRRVAACIDAGILERFKVVRSEPSLIRATREGLEYAGLGLPVAQVSAGTIRHQLRCVSTAQVLARRYGEGHVLTERELAFEELTQRRPLASAVVGELPGGNLRFHRPDLAVLTEKGVIAIEVELSPKAPRRLEALMQAWRRAIWVTEVHYFCQPGPTYRAVKRAVAKTRAYDKVVVSDQVSG